MYQIKIIAVAVVVAGAGFAAGAAAAKDLPSRAHNWTGFYAGVQAGYGFGSTDTAPMPFQGDGGLGGVVFGYNHQVGNLLLGVEGDFNFARIKGDAFINFTAIAPATSLEATSNLKWLSSVSGRLGFTNGPWLVYGKAGAAWANFDHSVQIVVSAPAQTVAYSGNETRVGVLVGAGIEYALRGPWSVRGEYNYINFGIREYDVSGSSSTTGAFSGTGQSKQDLHLVKLGLNYQFGAPTETNAIAPIQHAENGFDWTGFYVGGQIGYGASRNNWHIYDPDGAFTGKGVLAGGQVGANIQLGVVVLGVEAELVGGNVGGSRDNPIAPSTVNIHSTTDWLAIASARFGFVTQERWLTYVKGGVAAARDRHHITTVSGPDFIDVSAKHVHTGIVVGGGVEYAFAPQWSVNFEYNYIDFGRENLWLEGEINSGGTVGHIGLATEISKTMQIGKVGVNYHF